METTSKALPKKILSRKDEITAEFLSSMEKHVQDLLHGRATKRMHAVHFWAMLVIHPRHLTNTIKLTTGKSPCDFMEERLLLESEKLLAQTTMPIAEIGRLLGYSEPTNFTKFFKSMCGITPREYRKRREG